jgi:hypothetical protein
VASPRFVRPGRRRFGQPGSNPTKKCFIAGLSRDLSPLCLATTQFDWASGPTMVGFAAPTLPFANTVNGRLEAGTGQIFLATGANWQVRMRMGARVVMCGFDPAPVPQRPENGLNGGCAATAG